MTDTLVSVMELIEGNRRQTFDKYLWLVELISRAQVGMNWIARDLERILKNEDTHKLAEDTRIEIAGLIDGMRNFTEELRGALPSQTFARTKAEHEEQGL